MNRCLDGDDDDGAGGVREERMALLCAAGNTCTEYKVMAGPASEEHDEGKETFALARRR